MNTLLPTNCSAISRKQMKHESVMHASARMLNANTCAAIDGESPKLNIARLANPFVSTAHACPRFPRRPLTTETEDPNPPPPTPPPSLVVVGGFPSLALTPPASLRPEHSGASSCRAPFLAHHSFVASRSAQFGTMSVAYSSTFDDGSVGGVFCRSQRSMASRSYVYPVCVTTTGSRKSSWVIGASEAVGGIRARAPGSSDRVQEPGDEPELRDPHALLHRDAARHRDDRAGEEGAARRDRRRSSAPTPRFLVVRVRASSTARRPFEANSLNAGFKKYLARSPNALASPPEARVRPSRAPGTSRGRRERTRARVKTRRARTRARSDADARSIGARESGGVTVHVYTSDNLLSYSQRACFLTPFRPTIDQIDR